MNIEKYMGINIAGCLEGSARNLYLKNLAYMHEAFGDNVEYERHADQVLYCAQTRDYIYRKPEKPTYMAGSRPILEHAVKEACQGCSTDKEKVLALMAYIRDLKKKSSGYDYFYGGTEEDLIKKGERFCERVARLMVGLCEINAIPARTVWHLSGGHLTTEVYVDGKWGYIDPRFGLFYLDEKGQLMSVEEIVANPDVIFNQPEWVYECGSDEYSVEFMQKQNYEMYLAKREIQMYASYSLADAGKYHFEWLPSAAFPVPARDAAYREYADARMAYFDDEELYCDGVIINDQL